MNERPALSIRNGPLEGQRFDVQSEVVIGRGSAGIAIDDPLVSRRHAVVRPVGEGLEVEDMGSLNGTLVNDRRIQGAVPLQDGDVIRVGNISIDVTVDTRPPGTVAASPPPVVQHAPAPPPAQPFSPPTPAPQPFAQPVPATPLAPGHGAAPTRRRGAATRRTGPTIVTFGVIIATAVALIAYFALRGG